jgi:hypothetical protein
VGRQLLACLSQTSPATWLHEASLPSVPGASPKSLRTFLVRKFNPSQFCVMLSAAPKLYTPASRPMVPWRTRPKRLVSRHCSPCTLPARSSGLARSLDCSLLCEQLGSRPTDLVAATPSYQPCGSPQQAVPQPLLRSAINATGRQAGRQAGRQRRHCCSAAPPPPACPLLAPPGWPAAAHLHLARLLVEQVAGEGRGREGDAGPGAGHTAVARVLLAAAAIDRQAVHWALQGFGGGQ